MSTRAGGLSVSGAKESQKFAFRSALYWLVPLLVCWTLFWPGLLAWFRADDFAWLGMRSYVHEHSLIQGMFAPLAQGTIRPLSERAFFLVFESVFGLHPLPFRIWAFLTQSTNLVLLAAVTRRITRSPAAGFWAAIFWTVNSSLASPMVWSSAYNQILCGFFFLGAFWFLLRYVDSGRTRDYVGQWILFLLGFGALEVNVVYPVLAAFYTWLFARKYFKTTLPLFVPAALFVFVHQLAAPTTDGTVYTLHFDQAIFQTLATYSFQALVPPVLYELYGGLDLVLWLPLAIGLIAFAIVRSRRCDWIPMFCFGWFFVVISPFVPLRDHVSIYYLTVPMIGLAILATYALVTIWRAAAVWKSVGAVLAAIYLILMAAGSGRAAWWWQGQSKTVENLVLGVVRAHQLHPNQSILLRGVDDQLFWSSVFHSPFQLFGVSAVYLVPGSDRYITSHGGSRSPADFVLADGPTVHGLNANQIVVYQVGGPRLKAVTTVYEDTEAQQLTLNPPLRVDAANPLTAYLLGPEWYALENGHRWMPVRASLRIGGPKSVSEKLYLKGFCSPAELENGPFGLEISVDGLPLPVIEIRAAHFEVAVPMRNQWVGKPSIVLQLHAATSFRPPGDSRQLALGFGSFEIR